MTTPKSLRIVIAVLCLLVLSSAATGVAWAAEEPERDVLLSSFPGINESEARARGVAFDQVNNTVLVAAREGELPGEVRIFPATGGSSVGTLPVGEANGGLGEINGTFTTGIAVDAAGNVYVSDVNHHVVDKFEPVGSSINTTFKYACQYSGPGRGCLPEPEVELGSAPTFGEVSGLAVDSSGDLFVSDHQDFSAAQPESENAVDEFSAAAATLAQFKASDHPLLVSAPVGVAVDSAGNVYVQDLGHELVELERDASGKVTGETLIATAAPGAEPNVDGVTFDSQSGLLLIAEAHNVVSYDPVSKRLSEFFELLGKARQPLPKYLSVAAQENVGGATGDVYLENLEYQTVEIYGLTPPLKPVVSGEAVSAVTLSSAQLSATVEPELRATHYQFQFGADQSYSGGTLPAAPGAEIPAKQPSVLASVSLTGLTPGATYHYRLVATNKEGTSYGPDQTFTTFPTLETGLPDGRIWEMVSPLDKSGGGIYDGGALQASANGEKIAYVSEAAFGAAQGNSLLNQYLTTRGAAGWTTENISPAQKSGDYFGLSPIQAFSSDLSHALLRNGGANEGLPITNPPLPGTGAPPGYSNFYVRDNEGLPSYQALLTSPPALPNTHFYMAVEGFTPDLKHIIEAGYDFFGDQHSSRSELDEWSAGSGLVAVNVGVHGELVGGAVLASGSPRGSDVAHAVSDDGSRAFWSVGGDVKNNEGSEPVFVREGIDGSSPSTVQLPAGEFVDASAQTGARVLLSSGEVFDVEHDQRLTDLTEGLGGFVGELGASEDLSRIYFVDTAVLPGSHANALGAAPKPGANNLYLYREGAAPTFIATLVAAAPGHLFSKDDPDWSNTLAKPTRVTADGGTLLFQSRGPLTGYDNRDAVTAEPDDEVFRFDAASDALVCVSCNPTGQRPTGDTTVPVANTVQLEPFARAYYQPRALSADGARVFFDSSEALVEQDTNNAEDVYEYENGHVHLISGGTGGPSQFVDASENGDNVFFTTANELVPGDTDQLTDLYDARVGGGFPAPATEPACTGTGCQGIPAPAPLFATPSSETFNGVGNFPAGLTSSPPSTKKTAAQLRAEKLTAALKKCHAKRGKKRAACESAARHKYGVAKKAAVRKSTDTRR
jgi:hypothetical protein